MRVVWRPIALAEAEAARTWYDEQHAGLGQEFAREVAQAVAHITISPAAFPQVHDAIRRLLMRRFPYGIFYRDTAAEIVILGVTHLRREPQRWQRRS